MKLRIRRLRSRVLRALTPPVMAAFGGLALAVIVALALKFSGDGPATPVQGTQLPPAAEAPAGKPAEAPIPTVAVQSLNELIPTTAPAASASAKRKSRAPQHAIPSRSTPAPRAGQSSGKKSIRDFGF